MKILVVDDSRAMRRIVARTIRQAGFEGHEIVEAENGKEALDVVKAQKPDLILSDWHMPEMTGIEFLAAMNAEGLEIPFGFVTSESTKEMVDLATEGGAMFLLAKPFTAEDMGQVLGAFIS
ncbi:MAG: response regulator [bacterium]|nr:response regulator [bacterium]